MKNRQQHDEKKTIGCKRKEDNRKWKNCKREKVRGFFKPSNDVLFYLDEFAGAISKKYAIPVLLKRKPGREKEFAMAERRGAKIICNEFLRIALKEELSDKQKRAGFNKAKKIILQIFDRTYATHNEGAVSMIPEEKRFFEEINNEEFDLLYAKIGAINREIRMGTLSWPKSLERHFLQWTEVHLDKILTKAFEIKYGVV
ncbi:MAG: hypothetical protein PHH08_05195 [Candidatus ainarchaeum sp.]|nr:hypothetical protein [Candidatus ainarchaeum sp.]